MGNLVFQATLGGQVNLVGPNTASTFNINVPTVNGTFVTTGDTGTVTNTMLASSAYTAPGTIGSGTPNTGAFTTLSASGVASFAAGSAAAPALTRTGDTDTGIFFPAANTLAFTTNGTEDARFDSAGNFGLGVTPSAWVGFKALEFVSAGTAVWSAGAGDARLSSNTYYNGGYKFAATGVRAGLYNIDTSGTHSWNISTASGTAGNAITFTQAMTLDASGNLLVGVSSSNLTSGTGAQINNTSSADTRLKLTNAGTGSTAFDGFDLVVTNAGQVNLVGWEAQPMTFYTNSSERARIDSSGNLLVGTTSTGSSDRIVVDASIGIISGSGLTPQLNFNSSNANIEFVNRNSGGAKTFRWFYAASGGGTPATLSTSGVWTNASDSRGKENIADIQYGLSEVLALKPRQYDVKSDNSHAIGFVAQEVLSVIPEIVHGSEEQFYGLDYGSLNAVLVKAIQEQQAIIAQLQADVQALKG